jgi:hypothetical protein
MQKETQDESVACAHGCGSGKEGHGAKCNHQDMRQVADEFYKLARSESGGHYRGMLTGLLAAASIAGDDELLTHINRQMDQLKPNEPA